MPYSRSSKVQVQVLDSLCRHELIPLSISFLLAKEGCYGPHIRLFPGTNVPLLVLIEAAKSGNEKEVKEYAQVFREHANKLVEVSNI